MEFKSGRYDGYGHASGMLHSIRVLQLVLWEAQIFWQICTWLILYSDLSLLNLLSDFHTKKSLLKNESSLLIHCLTKSKRRTLFLLIQNTFLGSRALKLLFMNILQYNFRWNSLLNCIATINIISGSAIRGSCLISYIMVLSFLSTNFVGRHFFIL